MILRNEVRSFLSRLERVCCVLFVVFVQVKISRFRFLDCFFRFFFFFFFGMSW
jgi:chromosome condensin MukBEF MukE localization factor